MALTKYKSKNLVDTVDWYDVRRNLDYPLSYGRYGPELLPSGRWYWPSIYHVSRPLPPVPYEIKENISIGTDGYLLCLTIPKYHQVSVKTNGNSLVVKGTYEDHTDKYRIVTSDFVKNYTLPAGYNPKDVTAHLYSDGVLTVKALPPPPPLPKYFYGERRVPIQHVDLPA